MEIGGRDNEFLPSRKKLRPAGAVIDDPSPHTAKAATNDTAQYCCNQINLTAELAVISCFSCMNGKDLYASSTNGMSHGPAARIAVADLRLVEI
jgi:hypothetical protein